MITYEDSVKHLVDYVGGGTEPVLVRDARRAILETLRDITAAHNWSYLFTQGRINTVAPVTGLTVSYTQATGPYQRMFLLDDPTQSWPSWATQGMIRIGTANYRISSIASPTIAIASLDLNPGADLPALTPFTLYRDSYPLPPDFTAQDQALYQQSFGDLYYSHPRDWLQYTESMPVMGTPQQFTITGDPVTHTGMLIRFFPVSDIARSIDFLYKRTPRTLLTYRVPGTLISTGGTVLVSTTPIITPAMVGSVLRTSSTLASPTSRLEDNPPAYETTIVQYVNPTTFITADPIPPGAAIPFVISDPIDIEAFSMTNVFYRGIETHLAMNRVLKDKPSARLQYQEALGVAKAADSRSFMNRVAGSPDYVSSSRSPLSGVLPGPQGPIDAYVQ